MRDVGGAERLPSEQPILISLNVKDKRLHPYWSTILRGTLNVAAVKAPDSATV